MLIAIAWPRVAFETSPGCRGVDGSKWWKEPVFPSLSLRGGDSYWWELQEVLACPAPASRNSTSVVGDSGENGEVWVQVFAERHDGGDIAAAVAVVWRGPDCYYVLVFEVVLGGG